MDPQLLTVVVALIALVSGLGGVVVGQWMARRTLRLQLAEQRRRDRELWAREDKHRFTEEKRLAYAEFLAVAERYESWAVHAIAKVQHQLDEVRTPNVRESVDKVRREFVREGGYEERAREFDVEIRTVLARLELIAPDNIGASAASVTDKLCGSFENFVDDWDVEHALVNVGHALRIRDELTKEMRAGLAATETHSG